jgi:hypothetical protein
MLTTPRITRHLTSKHADSNLCPLRIIQLENGFRDRVVYLRLVLKENRKDNEHFGHARDAENCVVIANGRFRFISNWSCIVVGEEVVVGRCNFNRD